LAKSNHFFSIELNDLMHNAPKNGGNWLETLA